MNNALMKKMVFFCVMLSLTFIVNAQRTLYVSPTGTNNAAEYYPDWDGAATSIQAAVNLAENGDTVLVTNQVSYTPATNIAVFKSITVRSWSSGGLENPETTVVDCAGNTAGFYINNTGAVVSGFSVINGNGIGGANDSYGGGVYLIAGILSNCFINGNTAVACGGGVYAIGSNTLITHCRISGNQITDANIGGGGAAVYSGVIKHSHMVDNVVTSSAAYYRGGGGLLLSAATAENCYVVGNEAYPAGGGVLMMGTDSKFIGGAVSNNAQLVSSLANNGGGGIYLYQTINALIQNCTISSNSAHAGGGIAFRMHESGQGGTISNCIVANNYCTTRAGGIRSGVSNPDYVSDIKIYNTIIEGNVALSRSGGLNLNRGVMIDGCVIRNNQGGWHGGLWVQDYGSGIVTVRNTLIAGNSVGGISIPGDVFVENCTIVNNISSAGTGGVRFLTDGGSVSNSIVMFNSGGTADNWSEEVGATPRIAYSCTSPTNGLTGAGNIETDPLFIGTGNYRLQSGSPCINAGFNQDWMHDAVDMDGRPRIDRFSGLVDMGCYEYIARGTLYNVR